jgi:predicted  nucleic acid-binding Zn-ribbon protein
MKNQIVTNLDQEIQQLKEKIHSLETEIARLREENAHYRGQLEIVGEIRSYQELTGV